MGIAFNEREITDIKTLPGMYGAPDYPEFNFPVSHRENYLANMRGEGYWLPTSFDVTWFCPSLDPNNVAKGNVLEAQRYPKDRLGGVDMFGVEWVYEADIGGSTVMPGNPILADANDWREIIQWPDISEWDWQGGLAANRDWLNAEDRYVNVVIATGWFERLISWMDFENAAIALIDPDQKAAVKEIFEALTDLYIKMVDAFLEHFPNMIDGFTMHDDWGSQGAPFFSEATVREMMMPSAKRMVEYIHSKGLLAEVHSCGRILALAPVLVELGYDRWEAQPLVDKDEFYRLYGDKLMLTYTADALPKDATEDEARAAARGFVDKYFNKGTRCLLETYYESMPWAFMHELYVASRKKSADW
jgi:hypothetical protein